MQTIYYFVEYYLLLHTFSSRLTLKLCISHANGVIPMPQLTLIDPTSHVDRVVPLSQSTLIYPASRVDGVIPCLS